jgi:programmed cell death 6-interacting protein
LPPTLVSHAEEVRQQDGLNLLKRSPGDIDKIKASDKAAYTEGVGLLSAEKEEDDRARAKYGTDRWSRESSEVAARMIYKTANEIDEYFTSAENSDDLIEKKLRDSEKVLMVLSGSNRDLESYVPSSRSVAITPEVERESSRLRSCLNEVSRLENRRKRKIQTLKDKAQSDDISKFKYKLGLPSGSISHTLSLDPALLKETARLEREYPMQPIEASQFESLFEDHLRLYDTDLETLKQERSDQNEIMAQVREANRIFIKVRQGDSSTKEREEALQDLENGYLRYKEIISNIEMGRKFYNDLAKMLGRFRDDCKAFVQQRRVEASQLERYARFFVCTFQDQ